MDPTLQTNEPLGPNLDQSKTSEPQPAPVTSPTQVSNTAPPTATPTQVPAQATEINPNYAFPAAGSPESLKEPEVVSEPESDSVPSSTNDFQNTQNQPVGVATGMAAGVAGDALSSNSPTSSTIPEYLPDQKSGGKKKIFKIMAIVVVVLIVAGVAGFFYLKTQKTSTATLKEFSSATSTLSSESSALSSSMYSVARTQSDSNLDEEIKAFDEALASLEEKTAKLKTDKKGLKSAAEAYIKELKSYRESNVTLAVDVSKVSAVTFKLGVLVGTGIPSNITSPVELSAFISDLIVKFDTYSDELTALELNNENAKDYRDKSVTMVNEIKEIFASVKVAVETSNIAAVSEAQAQLRRLSSSSPAVEKEKEIIELLGYDSEPVKKVEAARKALNEEIDKVNKSR